jgi:hypothetical protein
VRDLEGLLHYVPAEDLPVHVAVLRHAIAQYQNKSSEFTISVKPKHHVNESTSRDVRQ